MPSGRRSRLPLRKSPWTTTSVRRPAAGAPRASAGPARAPGSASSKPSSVSRQSASTSGRSRPGHLVERDRVDAREDLAALLRQPRARRRRSASSRRMRRASVSPSRRSMTMYGASSARGVVAVARGSPAPGTPAARARRWIACASIDMPPSPGASGGSRRRISGRTEPSAQTASNDHVCRLAPPVSWRRRANRRRLRQRRGETACSCSSASRLRARTTPSTVRTRS